MTTRRKPEAIDPTVPFTPIDINGVTYKMCFDIRSLILAERKLNEAVRVGDPKIDIAVTFRELNLENTCILFAASLQRFHPEISFDDALNLITMPVVSRVTNAVVAAWVAALPQPDPEEKQNPQ